MAYPANVIRVMIASPDDVVDEGNEIRAAIAEWNAVNSVNRNLVLLPVEWRTSSAPQTYRTAQENINAVVLNGADLLVAVFWTKFGTPTGDVESGTASEVLQHTAAGKRTMVYFSTREVPPETVSARQLKAVKRFRQECESQWQTETFASLAEFRSKIRWQLADALNSDPKLRPPGSAIVAGMNVFERAGYSRMEILRRATRELVLVGPNLNSWLRDEEFIAHMLDRLAADDNFKVSVVVGTYEILRALGVDGEAILKQSVHTIADAQGKLPDAVKPRLEFYSHFGAATLSAVFVDHLQTDGVLFFTPRWGYDYTPDWRLTCLIERATNRELYDVLAQSMNMMRQPMNRRLGQML